MPIKDVIGGGSERVRFCPLGKPVMSLGPEGNYAQTQGNPPCHPLPSGPPVLFIDGEPVSLETDLTYNGCRECPLGDPIGVTRLPSLP